jgi:hypothetical protein
MVVYPNVDDIFGDKAQSIADAVTNNISQYAQRVSAASGNTMKNMDLQTLFNVQYDLIFKQKIPRRLVFKTVATAFIAQAEYRSHKRLPVAEVLCSPSGAQALNSLY